MRDCVEPDGHVEFREPGGLAESQLSISQCPQLSLGFHQVRCTSVVELGVAGLHCFASGLAQEALHSGKLLWKIRPKLHRLLSRFSLKKAAPWTSIV